MLQRFWRLLVVVLWIWITAFAFVGLDDPIGDGDEHVHATILRDMMRSGDYLRPRWQDDFVLERPLLPYWAAAPFASVVPGEVGVRASSALVSLLTLVVVFASARATWRRADAAFVAVLLLAGSQSFRAFGRALMSEPWLVLGTTIAVASTLAARRDPRWLVGVALGIGLAIAAKSLVALVPALALAPWLLRAAQHSDRRTRLYAWLVVASTALPYYALQTALHGERFLHAHFGQSLVARAVGDGGIGLRGGALAYLMWVPDFEGPVAAIWLLLGSVGALVWGARHRDPDLVVLGSYAITVVILLSLLATRLPHYMLPAYPAAALAVGGLYADVSARLGLNRGRFSPLFGPGLALAVLLEARGHAGGYAELLQLPASRELGLVAKRIAAPRETLYTLDWYGPALAYYAERPVVLLTENARGNAIVSRFVNNSRLVPPPPAPPGTRMLIAAAPSVLAHSRWLHVEEVVAGSWPIVLARVRMVP